MSKKKFGFGKIKDVVGRKVHQVKGKFGKASVTVDVQFDQEWKRFQDFQGVTKSTQKHLTDFIKAVQQLSVAETNLVECWTTVFDSNHPLNAVQGKATAVTGQLENIRNEFNEDLKRDIDEPLDVYSEQFKKIKKRQTERENRRTDMDRFKDEYEKLQRAGKDAAKVEELRVKYHAMEYYYERLNNELKKDIPVIIDDRALFYTPLFGQWIFHCHEYYRMAYEALSVLEQPLSGIDHRGITIDHAAEVITPEETSTYNMNIEAMQPADIDDEDGGYAPQQPQAAAPAAAGRRMPPPPGRGSRAAPPALPTATAQYDFEGQDGTELSFREGDVITIHAQDGEWWEGSLNGARGLLPATYVALN